MFTNDEGLVVAGEVDRSTDEGKQVWRQVKSGTASFSIGFASESRRRKTGKGKEIYEIDLLEISATSTPVHQSARVLDWKSTRCLDENYLLPDGSVVDYKAMLDFTQTFEIEEKRAQPIQIASFEC